MSRNVLMLVCDTARADAFEPYGAPPGATPAVARLAASGAAVPDMFATACWTLPSHASMFTGLMPRALGLGQAPGGTPQSARPVVEAQRDRLLPEVLRRAGWDTRAVSANPWVSPHAGFDTCFERFEFIHAGSRQERADREGLRGRLAWAAEGLRADDDDGASQAEAIIRSWLGEEREQPFFWFVNLVECHSPYLPPRPYNDMGPADRMRAADEARRHLSLEAIWRACLGEFDVPGEALKRMRHLYARSVRLMDDWLDRMLDAMAGAGVLDDTLVIVTSDHGENFGEGGLLAHAFSLDDRLIRVPFVVNRADFEVGTGARSLAEVPRLLAEHLQVADHPWGEDDAPGGAAAAQFDFVDENDPRVEIAREAWGLDAGGLAKLTTPLTCATDGALKLIRHGSSEALLDLHTDPLEVNAGDPRRHTDQERIAVLRAVLDGPAVQRLEPAELPAAPAGQDAEAADLEARMKLLGYM